MTHQAQAFANPNCNKLILSTNLALKIVENHGVLQKIFRYRTGFPESKISSGTRPMEDSVARHSDTEPNVLEFYKFIFQIT